MGDEAQGWSVGRVLLGSPKLWRAGLWFAMGLAWVVLWLFHHETFEIVIACAWLVPGIVLGVVAIHDRRHHVGAYGAVRTRGAGAARTGS